MPALLLAILTALLLPLCAQSESIFCYEIDQSGELLRRQIPQKPSPAVKCLKLESRTDLQDPGDLELSGILRRESMASSLGRIQLFWPRSVERLFGRTPVRAMAASARSASRALKSGGFPLALRTLDLDWDVVFLGSELPGAQIPQRLISNCHPGWMTPLTRLYFAADRISRGCSANDQPKQKEVVEESLTRVILHEMGHAIEFQMLDPELPREAMVAEGFAEWFESYAADFAPEIPRGSVRREQIELARKSLQQRPGAWIFQGTPEDYARASLFFHAIYSKSGVRGIARIYARMNVERIRFLEAIEKELSWSEQKLARELQSLLKSG